MDSLGHFVAFVRTAEALSFVKAGQALGLSASAVGKKVASLEARLQTRLLNRSTRRVSLTEEGALFYERCRRILDDIDDAEAALSRIAQTPRGKLRVSLPTIGYRFLSRALPEFSKHYPEIELDLDFNDRMVDLVDEGFDAVIRSGDLPDSALMSRRLGSFNFVLCAAPSYLDRHGTPREPGDLERHHCLRFRFPTTGKMQGWALRDETSAREPRLRAALTSNNMEAIRLAAIDGLGIAYMPDFLARDALAGGALCAILDDYLVNPGQFWILWPSSRHLTPKLRSFVDFVCARLFVPE
jgi:DNA-binding transcriptional LysR family regulator